MRGVCRPKARLGCDASARFGVANKGSGPLSCQPGQWLSSLRGFVMLHGNAMKIVMIDKGSDWLTQASGTKHDFMDVDWMLP
jgi:hypothetical protein